MQQQQQQHLLQMQPMMATYYPNNITTDHIQQYLDENKALILKIVESQNSGKINECAENQGRLQRNLMYLAAIADAQPPTLHSQYAASSVVSLAGGHYMQHQQAQVMTPQALMAARSSMMYSQQQPYAELQQQLTTLHPQMGMNSMGGGGLTILQGESNTSAGFSDFGQATTSKQDVGSSGSGSAEAHADGSENLYLKTSDEGN